MHLGYPSSWLFFSSHFANIQSAMATNGWEDNPKTSKDSPRHYACIRSPAPRVASSLFAPAEDVLLKKLLPAANMSQMAGAAFQSSWDI